MKNFLDLNGRAYKVELIQGVSKADDINTGVYQKREGIKWYSIRRYDFIKKPTYLLVLKYGTNNLKWIEGHHEYSDMVGEFYVEGHHVNDIKDIEFKYSSPEERDNEYHRIIAELNS